MSYSYLVHSPANLNANLCSPQGVEVQWTLSIARLGRFSCVGLNAQLLHPCFVLGMKVTREHDWWM